MNKEFLKDLKTLVKKYKLILIDECAYCGHGKECQEDESTCYYFTLFDKLKKIIKVLGKKELQDLGTKLS